MKKYMSGYMSEIEAFIGAMSGMTGERIREVLSEFEIKIGYFQHERLIHLIVTALFAVMEIIAIMTTLISPSIASALLSLMFMVLLVPYVAHYWFLENGVQKMYIMRDDIRKELEKREEHGRS
ncbi:MAG: hypothetical protein IKN14_07470 [Clostridiales bacterium]|nr:hypothetical protein [Clostridiales bacterium]